MYKRRGGNADRAPGLPGWLDTTRPADFPEEFLRSNLSAGDIIEADMLHDGRLLFVARKSSGLIQKGC